MLLMAPVFISKMVSTKYSESLNELTKNPSVEVVESQFSAQWFSAQSVTKLRLQGELGEVYPYDIVVQDDIQFGPIIFTDTEVNFNLAYTTSSFVLEEDSIDEEILAIIQDNLSLTSKVTYGLTYIISWDLSEITKEVSGNSFVIGAMQSDVEINEDQEIKGDYHWDGLTLTSPDSHIDIKGMDIDFDVKVVAGNIYAGNAISTGFSSALLPEINVKDLKGHNVFTLNKLFVSAQTQLKEQLLSSELVYQIDEIITPDLTLKAFELNMLFDKFELDALIKLNDLFISLPQDDAAQASSEQLNELSSLISLLFVNQPEITVKKLNVETSHGLISSDAKVVFKPSDFNIFEPMALLNHINADVKANAPKAFLNSMGIGELINVYTEHGFLRDEKENIALTLVLKDGQLKANDLVLPL